MKNELNDQEELEEPDTAVKEVYFPDHKTSHDDSYREIDRSQFEYIVQRERQWDSMIASSQSSVHHEEYGFQAGDQEIISKQEHKSFDDLEERVEGPPLWIWAVIVGAIILAKFTLRWSGLKRLARDLRKR